MENVKYITGAQISAMLEEEKKTHKTRLEPQLCVKEIDGLLFSMWEDEMTGDMYAVREIRTVHMGFNSNEPGKEEEFIGIMEREGACLASWGVTGRTAHLLLAEQFANEHPEYLWELDYASYRCLAKLREPVMVPMPGTTDPNWGEKHWGSN